MFWWQEMHVFFLKNIYNSYIFNYVHVPTNVASGGELAAGMSFSSRTSAFPTPRTLMSSTKIGRSGIVNPNSVWYLHAIQKSITCITLAHVIWLYMNHSLVPYNYFFFMLLISKFLLFYSKIGSYNFHKSKIKCFHYDTLCSWKS